MILELKNQAILAVNMAYAANTAFSNWQSVNHIAISLTLEDLLIVFNVIKPIFLDWVIYCYGTHSLMYVSRAYMVFNKKKKLSVLKIQFFFSPFRFGLLYSQNRRKLRLYFFVLIY